MLCQFIVNVSPKCLEWLTYLQETEVDEVEILKTPFGIIKPDEGLVQSFLLATLQVSSCGEGLRFTFYPPRQLEFRGELAQNIFSLIAPDIVHVHTRPSQGFLKRHSGKIFLNHFVEYTIHDESLT